ncbi:MAG: DNA polymerase III subunit gamma/tau [Candidatus Poribacteria bacterium]|nr:DNA polymerase III subunit gamma/tau [Candidatus Poribacteria bacterium]
MSYEVLAQKWRPQNFSDVVGQEHVTTTLKNQILSGRIGHAYLFWGPRGTGKTTVARILAKAVNCPNRIQETEFDAITTAEPCNQCEFCNDISQDRSFDVIEMDAASNRGIDTIRDLRENVKLSPAACPYKIYIIDEAHMLSPEAFNALLKTLEEPPPHVIFIMATTEHAKIPKTISSRCQDFDFRHLEDQKIIERLQLIVKEEEVSADSDVLTLITRQSEGCLRDAENLLERLIASAGKNLTIETVQQTIGLGSSVLLRDLTTAIIERHLAKGLRTLNDLTKQGTDLSKCLDHLIGYFRDLRLLAIDNNLDELVQSPKSDLPELKQKAGQMSVSRLSRIIRILMHTGRDIKQYGYPQLQLEAAFIQLNSLEEGVHLEEIVSKLSALEQKFDAAGIPTTEGLPPQQQPLFSHDNPTNTQATSAHLPFPAKHGTSISAPPDLAKKAATTEYNEQTAMSPSPDPNESSPSLTPHPARSLAELPSFWDEIKSKLPMRLSHGLLVGSVPTVNAAGVVEIPCSPSYLSLIGDSEKKIIVDILTQAVDKPVKIELVPFDAVPEPTASENVRQKTDRKTPRMRKIEAQDDPQLKTALELFDATVLETQ